MIDLPARFDEYERYLLVSRVVIHFSVLRCRIRDADAYIRLRAELSDGGLLEVSEYWTTSSMGEPVQQEYTYHWQTAAGELVKRWDNAPHHPELAGAPHHIHQAGGVVSGANESAVFFRVLDEIEGNI